MDWPLLLCRCAIAPLCASPDTKEAIFMSRFLIEQNAKHQHRAALEPVVADLVERVQRLEAAQPPPKLLSISATADFLGLSPASIYRLIGLGKLLAVKAGGKTLIVTQSARNYAASL